VELTHLVVALNARSATIARQEWTVSYRLDP
jgi:hypothetical protein